MSIDRMGMKAYFFIVVACTAVSPALRAATDEAKGRELAEVKAEIKRVGSDIKKLKAEKADRVEELRRLEKQFGDQVNVLNAIKAEIKQQEAMLQDIRENVSATQKALQAQRHGLASLVKSAYVMGDKRGVDVLLNQRDPAVSGRMLIYYDYIGKARVRKLQSIEKDVGALKRLEAQKDTETQLLQMSLLKKQQETDALRALKDRREKLLARLDNDYASKQERLAVLIQDQKKLEAIVASLQKSDDNAVSTPPSEPVVEKKPVFSERKPTEIQSKPPDKGQKIILPGKSFATLQGKLPWPVSGAIIERFGSRRFETTWDGAVIGAREGSDIHAVAAGRVVYADWLRGYGLMIIVDHEKGYMSLYAFNQSLHKNVGEYVNAGEILASVGRSGGRSKAALYFGIRVKGRAVDPEKWCRKLKG